MLDDRTSAEYQQWKQDVRKRDGNSCRRCGFDTNLEVHHIKPLVKYPEFAIEIDNGLTLCGNCHSLLRGREEATDLLKFVEESPYSRDERIVERLIAIMAEQLKALDDTFAELTRRKVEVPIGNDNFTEPGHIQAEMLRLEAEEKLKEAEKLRREADDAVKKRQREAEEKRQRKVEEQQQHKAEEKLRATKQQTSLRDFQERKSGHLSDNRASIQEKKRKNLGKPKSSHAKPLKQTNKASTRQRNNVSGKWKHKREVDRNRSKVKATHRQGIKAIIPKQLELRARKGDAIAQLFLGMKHRNVGNDSEAVTWYRKAAKQGEATAQNNLGVMYERGEGVVQDNQQAVTWYRKAAKQGYPKAQYNIGRIYAKGIGVVPNDEEAVKWFRKAAEGRYSAAQDYLNWMYQNGRGTE